MSKRRSAPEAVPGIPEIARLAGTLALEKKAGDIVLLDLRAFPLNTDFFLIASGKTEVHVRAIAEWIVDELARRYGATPWHVEGRTHGRWVLLDYVDWVVHIFHRETREYYLLERLWGDAPLEKLGGDEGLTADDDDDATADDNGDE